MIAANVAAARALEAKKAPVMYRVHEPPSREKLVALKDYLKTFGVEFALGQVIKPGTFNRIIERVGDGDGREEIMEQLLRTQMQARYGPERLGHFGLALATYAHFTSPIRRYADLLVHRGLVNAYGLGEGGLPPGDEERFDQIGEQISMLERRAMEAERDTIDRYVAAYLADRVGQLVECRITGVQPFGFFAAVEDLGGDGLVLAKDLGQEYFRYDEAARALVGDESGETYRVGQRLTLRLAEANPVSGSLRFELPEGSYGGAARTAAPRPRSQHQPPRPAAQYPPPIEAPVTRRRSESMATAAGAISPGPAARSMTCFSTMTPSVPTVAALRSNGVADECAGSQQHDLDRRDLPYRQRCMVSEVSPGATDSIVRAPFARQREMPPRSLGHSAGSGWSSASFTRPGAMDEYARKCRSTSAHNLPPDGTWRVELRRMPRPDLSGGEAEPGLMRPT